MASALDNLQQQVYDERKGKQTRYLVLSHIRRARWEIELWGVSGNENPRVWTGVGDAEQRDDEVAQAIRGGMLSIQERPNNGRKLLIHLGQTPLSVYCDEGESGEYLNGLLQGAFSLVSRPDESLSISKLTAQLEEKDAEIASLTGKLMSLKATVQRQTPNTGRRNAPHSPVKKIVPANASKLQPNQKRRKLVEEEFAGSEGESDDDEDGDEDDEEEDYDED